MEWPNGEPGSSPAGAVGGHPLAATGAATAEQAHLGHVRPDRRQFDALVDLLRGLRGVAGTPPGTSGRRSAWHRSHDPGSDAASGQRRAGSCAAGDPCRAQDGLASGPATAAWTSCPGSSAGGSVRRAAPPAPRYGAPASRLSPAPPPPARSGPGSTGPCRHR